MIRCFLLLTVLIGAAQCNGQVMYSNSGYRSVGTYSQKFTDVFSFAANQASLSQIRDAEAGVYSERRFMLEELTAYSAIIAAPLPGGGTALSADYTGGKNYNQSRVGLAYGRSLGEKAGLGIQFNYNRVRISGYGSTGTLAVELGSLFHFTEKLHAGCHVYKPFGRKHDGYQKERFNAVYSFGLGFEVSRQLLVNTVIEKEENGTAMVNVSLHYSLMKEFFLRGGTGSGDGLSFAGAGLNWKNFRCDVGASWHRQLGLSPSLLLVFRFKQEEDTNP